MSLEILLPNIFFSQNVLFACRIGQFIGLEMCHYVAILNMGQPISIDIDA